MANRKFTDLPYRRGVGILLLNSDRRIFVGRRIDQRAEAWQMPQGGIDAGEDPAAAAMRELAEEIGTDKAEIIAESAGWIRYDLPEDIAGRVWGGRYRGQEQKWFLLRFAGSDTDIDLEGGGHPEFDAWRWVRLEEAPNLIVPFKRPLYEAVVAEFAPIIARL